MALRIFVFVLVGGVLSALGGCAPEETTSDEIAIDSLDIALLVDLQLAEARAEVTGAPAESLRAEVLAVRGLDSTELVILLDSYATEPERAVALFERVEDRLNLERQGE